MVLYQSALSNRYVCLFMPFYCVSAKIMHKICAVNVGIDLNLKFGITTGRTSKFQVSLHKPLRLLAAQHTTKRAQAQCLSWFWNNNLESFQTNFAGILRRLSTNPIR